MGIVLDTSVLIASEKKKLNFVSFAVAHQHQNVFLAAVTAAEFLYGVERAQPKARRASRSEFAEKLFASIPILDYDLNVARRHASLWATLTEKGKIIGPYDLIIAASALEYGHSVATLNVGEFSRVPGISLVDVSAYLDR